MKNRRRVEALVVKLLLRFHTEGRAYEARVALFCEVFSDQSTIGAMVESYLQVKFLSDSYDREYIVGAVGVNLEGKLTFNNGNHRLKLHIKGRSSACLLGFKIIFRLEKEFS